jgi:hypothetical protein
MGKTSVSLAVANEPAIIARFSGRRHLIPCEEVTNPAPLIELVALHLGISLPSSSPLQHLLESLRLLHSPCLIVLDNFETPWDSYETRTQVEKIIMDISNVSLMSLIVTMRGRDPPAGVKWSHPIPILEPLSLSAARSTFLDICATEVSMLDNLLQALDFITPAVTLIASLGQSGQLTPSELLQSWKEEQTTLLGLGPSDRLKSIEYCTRLSIQSNAMKSTPEALQLLSVIALLPGGAIVKNLQSLAPNIKNLNRAVRVLVSVSLAYKDTIGNLRLLSPI